ncbi:HAD family hydrolase [Sunxiuqinia sp. A32]|uniref:HAD family hydrolase n=1 Tax=Sunxiuqinia sp. A32 TaxID=3461496 RepID=UPI00404686B9
MENAFIEKLGPFLDKIQPIDIKPTDAVPSYSLDKSIKAVIFDIYGTLIISASGDIMQSSYDSSMFKEALISAGYTIKVPEADLMEIHDIFGKNVIEAKEIAKENGTPFPELNIVEIWQKTLNRCEEKKLIESTAQADIKLFTFIFELKSNQVWPMPDLNKTLEGIKDAGYPMGIVSNAQFYTPVIMNYFLYNKIKPDEFIDGFENDISVFSYKMLKGKPDPIVYKVLTDPLKKRGLKPDDVLYVGNDMIKDIWAAKQVGFKTCFYAGDMRAYRLRKDHPEASKIKPDHTITSLKQLWEILGIQ